MTEKFLSGKIPVSKASSALQHSMTSSASTIVQPPVVVLVSSALLKAAPACTSACGVKGARSHKTIASELCRHGLAIGYLHELIWVSLRMPRLGLGLPFYHTS